MFEQILALTLLSGSAAFVILWVYRATRDRILVAVLAATALSRVLVGFLNQAIGPFPGAEVDAVDYENRAYEIASLYFQTGHYSWDPGRFGYSSIIALAYVIGGRNFLLPTLVNLIFLLNFLVLVYLIALLLGSPQRARIATLASAFFPMSILYTSVPLREAPLMWGLALFVYGVVLFLLQEARLFNWRVLLSLSFTTWLHTGFIFLGFLLPFFWWLRGWHLGVYYRHREKIVIHAATAVLVALLLVAAFLRFGRNLPKFPKDPAQLFNLAQLAQMRQYKASYGTGYMGYVPKTWVGMVLSVPLWELRFLFSPTPLDVIRSRRPAFEALKMIDSIFFLILILLAWKSLQAARQAGQVWWCWVILAILGMLLFTFAVGTANMGIAIRHRSKFAWLFLLIIALWHPGWKKSETRQGLP